MKKVKIGIVGCGAIGKTLAKFIDRELNENAQLNAICDLDLSRALALRNSLKKSKPAVVNLDDLINRSDLIIECASSKISYQIAIKALANKKDILLMSIGGIILKYKELFALARKNGCFIFLPSGAICGIDGLKALSLVGLKKVMLITRKPPESLADAEYIIKNKIDLGTIKKEKIIFEGNALSAIKFFPQNINVAALLSIVGIGPEKTRVRIITSPKYKRNSHQVIVASKVGKISTVCENVAFKENPKTSYLAALSAMVVLRGVIDSVKIGN